MDSSPNPIWILYKHWNDALRADLSHLSSHARQITTGMEDTRSHESNRAPHQLASLRSSILFLSHLHSYSSSVKIEVIYPALERKVKNVTLAYVLEHHDQSKLFDQLLHMLSKVASVATSTLREEAFGTLVCKVEEVHLMLKTHLKKEEDLLLPLLTLHFSHSEQAELIAQLFYSIPLIEIDNVLAWLKPSVPIIEQAYVLSQIELVSAVPNSLLLQLLSNWLSPSSSTTAASDPEITNPEPPLLPPTHSSLHSPITNIAHIHRAISRALQEFSREARSLQKLPESTIGGSKEFSSLLEHFRFIMLICLFHSSSEEHVIYPAFADNRAVLSESHSDAIDHSHKDDEEEIIEKMNELLTEVRTLSRRGKKEAVKLIADLCTTAELCHQRMTQHMEQEERDIFPLLEQNLSPNDQRLLFWKTIKSMPLRLLEKVVPFIISDLCDEDRSEFLSCISLGAPSSDSVLVQLLFQWASTVAKPLHIYPLPSCNLQVLLTAEPGEGKRAEGTSGHGASPQAQDEEGHASADGEENEPEHKRRKITDSSCTNVSASHPKPLHDSKESLNPIDHIFQFHQALRLELKGLEEDASRLEKAIMEGCPCAMSQNTSLPAICPAAIKKMDGRFQFVWGIYQAHSRSEDEIVFPALESKDALRNVSHAYTIDHQQEELLFVDLEAVIARLRASKTSMEARPLALDVRKMCAAIRAALETHVKSEEAELWPLFAEHFTTEEQQYLVGVIIGRTGAQVLQTLLPWVSATISQEEKEAMETSLRLATKNTMFNQWLSASLGSGQQDKAPDDAAMHQQQQKEEAEVKADDEVIPQANWGPISEVVEYLSSAPPAINSDTLSASALARASSSTFRPGWEDIFRMNQSQLETAIHRVTNDKSLDLPRKAYIIQNIMTTRYIVAQQKRMKISHAEPSPADDVSSDGSHFSILEHRPSSLGLPPHSRNLRPEELEAIRSYHPSSLGSDVKVLGCKHYQRKCQLIAPCCGKAFTCRLCHDEAIASHRIDRFKVSEVLCMMCGARGPAAKSCCVCKADFSAYYCDICHLFDDNPSHSTYHCPFCNLCRRGKGLGIDYCHCMSCNSCMSMAVFKNHVCRSRALESDCPICSESLFDSPHPVRELDPCGHLMHSHCFATYSRYNYKCPICSKSIGDMTVYFQMLDSLLASERLPPEFAGRTQLVSCLDCGKSGFAPWHYVYHKCPHCSSYNTKT